MRSYVRNLPASQPVAGSSISADVSPGPLQEEMELGQLAWALGQDKVSGLNVRGAGVKRARRGERGPGVRGWPMGHQGGPWWLWWPGAYS